MDITPVRITETDEWKALAAHQRSLAGTHLRQLFADDPGRGEHLTLAVEDLYLDYSKHRLTAETIGLLVAVAERAGLRRAHRGHVRRRAHQHHRGPGRAARRPARPRGREASSPTGPTSSPRSTRCSTGWPTFAERVRTGAWQGAHGQAHRQRGQHRHRRLRPGPGHGLRGAADLRRPFPDGAVRFQRRRQRHLGGDPRPRPGGDAVHRELQDLHHPGDHHQRHHRPASGCSPAWVPRPTPTRSPATSSPCPPTPPKCPSSASTRTTCSASGTGWAAGTPTTRPSGCRS